MHFFHALQTARPNTPPPAALPQAQPAVPRTPSEACGWFDSSFDLAAGLEVSEQDCDTLYQLWQLS
ncbi:MAG: hypothetical protein QM788_05925 [Roseateles sp.]|uniref:hypothetical protein n=1 Tax=Roseateles sp. TaxID=1971397 RepID=UPI0039E9AA53